MFENLVFDNIGLIHLVRSIIALVTGTMVLVMNKGTSRHKKIGYVYSFSMVLVLITAFMIYRLFGRFGVLHIAAIVSTLTLLAGMVPALFMRNNPAWVRLHIGFMYWSVMGLYAAFIAESMVRIPSTPFFGMIGVATGAVMLVGGIFYVYYKKSWNKTFAQ